MHAVAARHVDTVGVDVVQQTPALRDFCAPRHHTRPRRTSSPSDAISASNASNTHSGTR